MKMCVLEETYLQSVLQDQEGPWGQANLWAPDMKNIHLFSMTMADPM